MNEPAESEPYFHKYLRLVPEDTEIAMLLRTQQSEIAEFLSHITSKQSLVVHAPYLWTAREVLNHMSDCERVFGFRLLWIARGEVTPLPSFDDHRFSVMSRAMDNAWDGLAADFDCVRRCTLSLIELLPTEAWDRTGVASGFPVTVEVLANMIYGHVAHHFAILKTRFAGSWNTPGILGDCASAGHSE